MEKLSLSQLQANMLRLTAFPTPNQQFNPESWWASLINQQPENTSTKSALGEKVAEGSYGSGTFTIGTSPLRIDLVYKSVEKEETLDSTIPVIGNVSDTVNSFQQLIEKWFDIESIPSISRLAFGGILVFPVENLETGYNLLSKYVKLDIDEQASDLLYRINRRRNSTIYPSLVINRLSTWGVMVVKVGLFDPNTTIYQLPETYAFRVELDINTVPNEDNIVTGQWKEIFGELVILGKEIAELGDIK